MIFWSDPPFRIPLWGIVNDKRAAREGPLEHNFADHIIHGADPSPTSAVQGRRLRTGSGQTGF